MQLNRIVFPFDFSEVSRAAFPLAQSLARDAGAALDVVYVDEPPLEIMAEGGIPVSSLARDTESLTDELKRAVPVPADVSCEHHVLIGSPAAEIVRHAQETKADLIVMSTHGRRGLSHFLMGSVAEAVVRKARCPVMTLRAPAQ
jgi:nucleotide-binding universal stress UspA family protein